MIARLSCLFHIIFQNVFYQILFSVKVGHTPRSFNPKRLIFVALCNDLIDYFIVCFEHQCNIINACILKSRMVVDSGRFMKNFRFNTICNITQDPQELRRCNRVCRFIVKSAVIRCHQLLSKVSSTNRRLLFDQ